MSSRYYSKEDNRHICIHSVFVSFQDPLNGLTPNTDVDIGIVTPSKKSIGSDEVIIDMHLHNHSDAVKRI